MIAILSIAHLDVNTLGRSAEKKEYYTPLFTHV